MRVATAATPTIVFHVTHRIKRYPDCTTTVKAGKVNFLFEFYTIEKRICNIIVNRSCYIIAAAMVIHNTYSRIVQIGKSMMSNIEIGAKKMINSEKAAITQQSKIKISKQKEKKSGTEGIY